MTDLSVTCPNCSSAIPLSESLAAPLIKAKQDEFKRQLQERDEQARQDRETIRAEREALEEKDRNIEAAIALRLEKQKKQLVAEQLAVAKRSFAEELAKSETSVAELKTEIERKNDQLADAQKEQAEFVRQRRDLEDAKRQLDLTVQKGISDGVERARKQVANEVRTEMGLSIKEKDIQIESMQKQIEILRQKAEQGSQQLQGDAQEVELYSRLKEEFPNDQIERVGKGKFGGDCLQVVFNSLGKDCGTILWESKRTREWSKGWLNKLKGDQREAKAEVSIIVSQVCLRRSSSSHNWRRFGLLDLIASSQSRAQ